MTDLSTPRLRLRQWRESDLAPFAALNADPQVMEFMPGCLTGTESDALARRSETEIARQGWGLWAAERRESGEFIGFVGLRAPSFEAHFTPCVEIGWRLARTSWGQGLATEAARECLRFAFQSLALSEVVSFTVGPNRRSRAVMERLGMRHDAGDDFEHPRLPAGHPLRRHVLYRLGREDWWRVARKSARSQLTVPIVR
jgi:RimJ/RimL family protein N-acetyltransferase